VPALDANAARRAIEAESDVLDAIAASANAVVADWPGGDASDGPTVADSLGVELRECGVLANLPGVLEAAVDAAGGRLSADPVPAPPYVAVTSRGPVLRATLDGGRLVATLAVFRVTDDHRYERTEGVAVEVEVR
jgi:hypothetical protein